MANVQSRYNRTNFCDRVNPNGVSEIDMLSLSLNFSLFENNNGYTYYYITADDLLRPDLLSLRLYGTMDYWWIISSFNHIEDWWNDVTLGMRISVPNLIDIQNFYTKFRNHK